MKKSENWSNRSFLKNPKSHPYNPLVSLPKQRILQKLIQLLLILILLIILQRKTPKIAVVLLNRIVRSSNKNPSKSKQIPPHKTITLNKTLNIITTNKTKHNKNTTIKNSPSSSIAPLKPIIMVVVFGKNR
jgi:hypothetical protein